MLRFRMANFHVIIPAAGSGSRIGAELPKQYLPLLGRPLIIHTLAVFIDSPRIATVNVILSEADTDWRRLTSIKDAKLQILHCGGGTRAATVLNGLKALAESVDPQDWVLVHDAARPGLNRPLLDRLLDTLQDDAVGGLLAIPLADTLKRADGENRVSRTEPREHLWQAQTPQMFRYGMLKEALEKAGGAPTDEAQAIEALGFKPRLVPGELRNLKITYPQDLAMAEAILAADHSR
jgi:2-C-methyl-D-erythritol 4-phosphate cytidylyltransferase